MRLVDTHAHLDDRDYAADREAVIARAAAESIGIVTVGVHVRSSEEAVRLAARHSTVWAAVGVHPHDAKRLDAAGLARFEVLAGEGRVVAIGEIGLDYYRDLSPRDVQRRALREQFALARRLSLPVVLHNREATADLLAILDEAPLPQGGVVHSFLGDRDLAEAFLERGLHLGIGGPITFGKNEILSEAVAAIPLERILLETDCPYLTPVPHRGKRNEPLYVRHVAEAVGRIKGVSVEKVAQQTTENARALFKLSLEPSSREPPPA